MLCYSSATRMEALLLPHPGDQLPRSWRSVAGVDGPALVYAVWAAREDFARSSGAELLAVEEELVRCLGYARNHRSEVVESALGRYRFDRPCLHFARLR